jgi:hypothetical protein
VEYLAAPEISFIEEEDGPTTCAFGLTALMIALACAIAVGVTPMASTGINAVPGALLLILFSLVGGYLVSKGLIFTLRDSGRDNKTSTE